VPESANPNQIEPVRVRNEKKYINQAGRLLPLLSLSTTLADHLFAFPFTQPPPPLQPFQSSFTLHRHSRPLQSPLLPLTVASSSPVNELMLFSDDHSSNLERNRRACEVAKLLPLPDLLQSIASIKADYITQVILSCNYRFN